MAHLECALQTGLEGSSVPGPNEEYFIYQTLLGAWPLDPDDTETFVERLQTTLVKSWREAKLFTSWSNPHKDYENAVAEFVATILTPAAENHFLPDFSQAPTAHRTKRRMCIARANPDSPGEPGRARHLSGLRVVGTLDGGSG